MEYQLRNWYYFVWICGDHIVEQHIHNLDVINWVKNGHPVKARSMGGREIYQAAPTTARSSIISPPNSSTKTARSATPTAAISPAAGTASPSSVQGPKASATSAATRSLGENQWRYEAEGTKDPYQQEHDDLFAAIRADKPYSEAEYGAHSTMTAIFGRMAAYSGKELEWDAALNSKIELFPKILAWDADPGPKPGADGYYPRADPRQDGGGVEYRVCKNRAISRADAADWGRPAT